MSHLKPLSFSQRFNEVIRQFSEKNIPKPESSATIDFSNGLNKSDSEIIHPDESQTESEDLINPFDDPVKENLVKSKKPGFRTTFSKIFESVHHYLTPRQRELWDELNDQRYGERHQDVIVYFLLFYQKRFSIRSIAEYLGRKRSSIHRSIQKLERIGFFKFKKCKFNPSKGCYDRIKIIFGASGLMRYRAEKSKAAKEKHQASIERQNNHIQAKLGGTLYPIGNKLYKRTSTNCSGEVDFSNRDHYYDHLLDNVTPLFGLEEKIDMTPEQASKEIRSVFFKKRPWSGKIIRIYRKGNFGQTIEVTRYNKRPIERKGQFGQIINDDCQGYGTFGRMMPSLDPPDFRVVRASMSSDEEFNKWCLDRYGMVVSYER